MNNEEYGQRPFYAGATLRGVRAFSVDTAGQLYGLTYPTRWLPGENERRCYNYQPTDGSLVGCPCPLCSSARGDAATERWSDTDHPVCLECSCGFYAITDSDNEYMCSYFGVVTPRVEGVVEGYGTVVVGSKGFRAEKARIVALVVPKLRDNHEEPARSWFDLTEEERKTRRARCEAERARYFSFLPPSYIRPPDYTDMSQASKSIGAQIAYERGYHMTEDIEVTLVGGAFGINDKLNAAYYARCSCLFGLAEYVSQLQRSRAQFTSAGDNHYLGKVPRDAIIERYKVPVYETLAEAKEAFPIVGQHQFRPSTDSASTVLQAQYVDLDRPDLGEV